MNRDIVVRDLREPRIWPYFVVLVALGVGYMLWLDYGCAINGVMTWTGKICI